MIWLFAALLVAWGNVVGRVVQPVLPGGDWVAVAWGAALLALSLVSARVAGLPRADLGIVRGDVRGIAAGAAVGVVAATAGAVLLRAGPLVGPVAYTPLFTTTAPHLAAHVALFLPLSAAIPEELAFRGTLLGGLRGAYGERIAIAGSSVAFALWHVSVVWETILRTSLASTPLAWLLALAALAFVAIGAAVLARLRLCSRTLVAPVLAHWCFDAVLLVGLWV